MKSHEDPSTISAGDTKPDSTLIRCTLDAELGMFRVLEARGKALSSGGYGVSIPRESDSSDVPAQYLFIEDVVYLHGRGFLECIVDDETVDMAKAFSLLSTFGMSLPMYLVYSHLRSQDFRVLRHCPRRRKIIEEQLSQDENDKCTRLERNQVRQQIRSSIAEAKPPRIEEKIGIAWDVYNPNSNFAKTRPGYPDFYVAVSFYNDGNVYFPDIHDLALEYCMSIPLKIATVSDSGTVVMFGVSESGVPNM